MRDEEDLQGSLFDELLKPEVRPPEDPVEEIRVSRAPEREQAPRARLAGPTLDDAVSRAWEGLVARVPAACPVCHNEIAPAPTGPLHGECGTCGITLD
jgi:hypothetical protein